MKLLSKDLILHLGIVLASWYPSAYAGNTITANTSYIPVIYGEGNEVTINITKSSSTNDPTYLVLTSGTVTSCSFVSSTPTSVTFKTLAANINTSNTCTIQIKQLSDGVTPEANLTIPITINKATQLISAEVAAGAKAGEASYFYVSSTGTNNPITVTPNGNCPVNTNTGPWTVTPAISGSCIIYLNKKGDANYNDVTSFKVPFTIAKGDTNITFTNPPNPLVLQYNKPYSLTVKKTGSTSVLTGATSTGSICTVTPTANTVSPFIIKGTGIGICNVVGSADGSTHYNAGSNTLSIQIVKADQKVTATRSGSGTLNINQTDTITVTTDHPGTSSDPAEPLQVSVTDPAVCSISGTGPYTIKGLKGGTCQINATQAGNSFYNPGNSSLAITINKLPQPITTSLQATATGAIITSLEISKTADILVAGAKTTGLASGISRTPTVCTVSGVRVVANEFGTCTIDVTQPGDSIYDSGVQTITFPTFKSPQVITVSPSLPTLRVNETTALPVTGGNSNNPVTLAVVSGPCTTFGISVTGTGSGSCTLRATQPGNTYFADAAPVEFPVFINPGVQTITISPISTMTPQETRTVSATSSNPANPIKFSSLTLDTCEIVLPNTVKAIKAGNCKIGAQQDGDANYLQGNSTLDITIRGTQTITFDQPAPVAINAGPATLNATASSGLTVSLISTTPSICVVSGTSATLLKIGTCEITASQDGNATYLAATPVSKNLVILAPPSSTVITSSSNPVKVRKNVTFTATVSGNAPTGSVSFLVDGAPFAACTAVPLLNNVATCTTSKLKAGKRSIVASYSGDANNQSSQSAVFEQKVISLDSIMPLLNELLD